MLEVPLSLSLSLDLIKEVKIEKGKGSNLVSLSDKVLSYLKRQHREGVEHIFTDFLEKRGDRVKIEGVRLRNRDKKRETKGWDWEK